MPQLAFKSSAPLTFGVELELMLLDTRNWNLASDADDLLRRVARETHGGELKPEITQSMVEINSAVHTRFTALRDELRGTRDVLARNARRMNVALAGGGTHPFQTWSERRIYPTERFLSVSEKYGFLAKQFTVFGQHIHVGCASADDAVYLTHAFSRYVPHFIALAASSPFYQGVDTAFDSSRLSVVNAFPLSGTMPWSRDWAEFNAYYDRMHDLRIVQSMKDFYWDVRPKPEYGTVEIRVCDTPLTVDRAAEIAALAQALAAWLWDERPALSPDVYLVHSYNRFQACRHGLAGTLVDAVSATSVPLLDDLRATLRRLAPYAQALGSTDALDALQASVASEGNDAAWLRARFDEAATLPDVVRQQAARFMG